MSYTEEELENIFAGGTCYHCGAPHIFSHYGNRRSPWGWCVDHGNPTSRGGVDDLRN